MDKLFNNLSGSRTLYDEMIRLYNQYQNQANAAIKAYEQKYGPILQGSLSRENAFSWEAYAWPWEMEEM